ncbi:MAG: hypothetical protein ACRCVV_10785 [Shewanella sp.]
MSENNYVSVDAELTDVYKPLTDILGLQYDGTMSYEERVQKRYNYVKEQLELDPNYEGWDWVEYQVYSNKQDDLPELLSSDKALVSTKGKIAKKKLNTKGFTVSIGTLTARYLRIEIKFTNGDNKPVAVQRVVTSTFVPRDVTLEDIPYLTLTVSHGNGIPTHNQFNNLSWKTKQQAINHSLQEKQTEKVKVTYPVVGTFTKDGEYKNKTIVFNTRKEIIDSGLDVVTIYQVLRGELQTAFGCTWKCTDKEQTSTLPENFEQVLYFIKANKGTVGQEVKPILATVIKEGQFKGTQFVLMGRKEVTDSGFDQAHVSKVCNGKLNSHKGCSWKYITQEEASKIPRGITPELKSYLLG